MPSGAGAQTAPSQAAGGCTPFGALTVVRDYVTLTKPTVQSLLLLTTVTTMYVAGNPSLRLILLTCLGGASRPAARGRSTTPSTATSTSR